MTSKPPAVARPASTVMMIRDGDDGLEVFMVKRHHAIDFASGALVFPGGKVNDHDHKPALRDHADDAAEMSDYALALRIAAIREAFEETGVLLAHRRNSDEALVGSALADLLARYRKPLEDEDVGMVDLAVAEDVVFSCDQMVPFAHWITPEMMPKRFDTYFYLCPASEDVAREAAHDGSEAVDSVWIRPQDALDAHDQGTVTLVFATQMNLKKLARSATIAAALKAARADTIVTVMPAVTKTETGRVLRIPAEAGYGVSEVEIPST